MCILTIAQLTFRESTRRKIAQTALILGGLLLILFNIGLGALISQFQASEWQRISGSFANFMALTGLYAVNFLLVILSGLIAADSLAGEISSGSIQSLVTKPLRRAEVVLGKWLGFAGLLAIYLLLVGGGMILSVYIQTGFQLPKIVAGIVIIYLESLMVMSITLACSSRLSTLATGGVVFGLYGLAFVGGWVEQIGAMVKSQTAVNIGILTSLIMPSEALWRRAAYEMSSPLLQFVGGMTPFTSSSVPSPLMLAYALLYLFIALWLCIRAFSHRDL